MSDDRPAVPLTAQQLAVLRAEAQRAAKNARVASQILPLDGPLPPEQTTIEINEIIEVTQPGGEVTLEIVPGKTFPLITVSTTFYLRGSQVADPDLIAARALCRRGGEILGRLEDLIVFQGQRDSDEAPPLPSGKPLEPKVYKVSGGEEHPGLWRLAKGTRVDQTKSGVAPIVGQVTDAIQDLEMRGRSGPYHAVFGKKLFADATRPTAGLSVAPYDSIRHHLENGPLLHSSALPEGGGLIMAMASNPAELVIGTDLDVRYLTTTADARVAIRLSERFAVRINDPKAFIRLAAADEPEWPDKKDADAEDAKEGEADDRGPARS